MSKSSALNSYFRGKSVKVSSAKCSSYIKSKSTCSEDKKPCGSDSCDFYPLGSSVEWRGVGPPLKGSQGEFVPPLHEDGVGKKKNKVLLHKLLVIIIRQLFFPLKYCMIFDALKHLSSQHFF